MNRIRRTTRALAAADVMSRAVVSVHHRASLRAAVRELARWPGTRPVTG